MLASQRKRAVAAGPHYELGLGDLVAEIRKAGGRVLLTRKGRAAGVALDLNSYRSIMDQVEQIEAMRVFNVASMILRPSAR